MDKTEDVIVERGFVSVLRLYEVAYEIDLDRVQELAAGFSSARIRLRRAKAKAIAFGTLPVELSLGAVDVELSSGHLTAAGYARVYDFGAVTITFRFPLHELPWERFCALTTELHDELGGTESHVLWTQMYERVSGVLSPAYVRPSASRIEEDYLITNVQRFGEDLTADELKQRVDLTRLLAGEERALSAATRADLMQHSHSYFPNDLVVVSWDHAFIYDPSGDSDIADVLEVANVQLLELRYYDGLLDEELPRMNNRVELANRAFRGLGRRGYARLARDLRTLVAEITEVTERVDNALIVTEDTYLARVYSSAIDLFKVRTWNASVERKLSIIRDTYATLYDEAATARGEILEITIVLLILFEILMALFG